MSGIDRKQTLRIDCTVCQGKGYVKRAATNDEIYCEKCEGRGSLEKEVGYKFESHGKWSREEIAEEFGISADQVRDEGHSNGD